MLDFTYFGKRFDLILTSDYKEFSLGFVVNYYGISLDLVFVQVTVHFRKDYGAPGRV